MTDLRVGALIAITGYMLATAGCSSDAIVSSMPPKQILAVANGDNPALTGPGIALVRLNGTGWRQLTDRGTNPRWLDRQHVVFHGRPVPGLAVFRAYIVNLEGEMAPLTPAGTELYPELWPVPSPDGQWIYFYGGRLSSAGLTVGGIWRTRGPGGLAARPAPELVYEDAELTRLITVSPDGSRLLVYAHGRLAVLEVATKTLQNIGPAGVTAAWSRRGDLIATVEHDNTVRLIRPDGTAVRSLGAYSRWAGYGADLEWSPDARTLLAAALDGLFAIELDSGEYTRFPWSGGLTGPAWQPGSWRSLIAPGR